VAEEGRALVRYPRKRERSARLEGGGSITREGRRIHRNEDRGRLPSLGGGLSGGGNVGQKEKRIHIQGKKIGIRAYAQALRPFHEKEDPSTKRKNLLCVGEIRAATQKEKKGHVRPGGLVECGLRATSRRGSKPSPEKKKGVKTSAAHQGGKRPGPVEDWKEEHEG